MPLADSAGPYPRPGLEAVLDRVGVVLQYTVATQVVRGAVDPVGGEPVGGAVGGARDDVAGRVVGQAVGVFGGRGQNDLAVLQHAVVHQDGVFGIVGVPVLLGFHRHAAGAGGEGRRADARRRAASGDLDRARPGRDGRCRHRGRHRRWLKLGIASHRLLVIAYRPQRRVGHPERIHRVAGVVAVALGGDGQRLRKSLPTLPMQSLLPIVLEPKEETSAGASTLIELHHYREPGVG
jgi:hypothetical protein